MATKKLELNVDNIGNQKEGLTKKEEKSLSDYFKKLKSTSRKRKTKTSKKLNLQLS